MLAHYAAHFLQENNAFQRFLTDELHKKLALQAGGRRFDPVWLHHPRTHRLLLVFNGLTTIARDR